MTGYRLMWSLVVAIAVYLVLFSIAGAAEASQAVSIEEPGSLALAGVGLLVWVGRVIVGKFSARRHGTLLGVRKERTGK